MSALSPQEIQEIIERVHRRLGDAGEHPGAELRAQDALSAADEAELGDGIFPSIGEAVHAASRAAADYQSIGLQGRKAIVAAIRASMLENAERLAEMAVAETGLGRVADKIVKNRLVIAKTPGPEDLELEAVTGDEGMMVTEFAPFGVVAAITPTTNPTSTIINNTIAIVSAGNSLVFNVHPNAKRVSAENIRLINRAVVASGGPENLVTATPEPTIESAKELMHHPDVRLLLVTGGPAVVREALKTDKRAVTAGPGNPPAVVDQTADVDKAGRDVVAGASFDNNVICTDEKTTIVVDTVADRLVRAMGQHGGYVLKEHELKRLERVIFTRARTAEQAGPHQPGLDRQGRRRDPARDRDPRRRRRPPGRGRGAARAPPGLDRADDAGDARRARPERRAGDRSRRALGARLPAHRVHPLDERRDDHADGPGDELQHLRGERAELLRARTGRRGLLVVLDREPHRATG